MTSSGVRVDTRIIFAECGEPCDWAGEVDEWFDPESRTAHWECPACGTQHDTSDIFDDTEDPDAAHDRRGEDA